MSATTPTAETKESNMFDMVALTTTITYLRHDLLSKDRIILMQIEAMKKQRERIDALEKQLKTERV